MREAFILGFRFRYLNEKKRRQHFFQKIGSVTRDGIVLNDQIIFFRDILPSQKFSDYSFKA